VNSELSDFWENFGFAPPMGSKIRKAMTNLVNLTAGDGAPKAESRLFGQFTCPRQNLLNVRVGLDYY
jgi:hypothetical protein